MSDGDWEDIAVGPPVLGETPFNVDTLQWEGTNPQAATDSGEWEDVAMGAAKPQSWGDFGLNLGKSTLQGVLGLGQAASMLNPSNLGNRIVGLPTSAETMQSDFDKYVGKPKYDSASGRIAGKVAEYLPSALIPVGEVGILKNLAMAALSGAGGGVAIEAGAPEFVGAVAPLGLASLIGGASKAASSFASDIAPLTAEEKIIQSLGVGKRDLRKFAAKRSTDASPLVKTLDSLKQRGFFSTEDVPTLIGNNNTAIDSYGNAVNTLLKEVDQSGKTFVPSFPKAEAFLEANPELVNHYQNRQNIVASLWDGTLQSLNAAKQKLYKLGYQNQSSVASKQLDRIMGSDLKDLIEREADSVSAGVGQKIKETNALQGEHLTVGDLLDNAKRGLENTAINEKPAKLGLFDKGSTAGGLAAILSGYPGLGLGVLAGNAALHAAESDPGRRLISGGLGWLGGVGQKATPSATNLIPALSSLLGQARAEMPAQPKAPVISINPQVQPMSASEDLVNKVIKAESAGNAKAIGPVTKNGQSALGLMQIMPATFKEWSGKLGIENADPFNAEHNKKVGTAYLNFLLHKYDQNPALALAGYNWGLGNLDKLISKKGTADITELYPSLPSETQAYLRKILGGKNVIA